MPQRLGYVAVFKHIDHLAQVGCVAPADQARYLGQHRQVRQSGIEALSPGRTGTDAGRRRVRARAARTAARTTAGAGDAFRQQPAEQQGNESDGRQRRPGNRHRRYGRLPTDPRRRLLERRAQERFAFGTWLPDDVVQDTPEGLGLFRRGQPYVGFAGRWYQRHVHDDCFQVDPGGGIDQIGIGLCDGMRLRAAHQIAGAIRGRLSFARR